MWGAHVRLVKWRMHETLAPVPVSSPEAPTPLQPCPLLQEPHHQTPETPLYPMDKIGFQKHIYQRLGLLFHTKSWPSQLLERLLLRPQSPASGISDCPLSFPEAISEGEQSSQLPEPTAMVTVGVLDLKLHTLLHNLTQNITKEVWKIEEDNTALKHTVSQIQLQQEDLENREHRQNLRIRGVHESISDKKIRT